jgi:glycosyltransferase involved in cell wall biosynthesis
MRILIINSEFPPIGGGAGNASANLAKALAALGQEVVVITSKYLDLPETEELDEVQIKRVAARRQRSDRSNALEQISFIFGGVLGCFKFVRTWRPDIVLAFFGIPSGAIGLLLRWVYKIPYIVSLRGGDVPGFRPYDFALYHRLVGPFLQIIWHFSGAVVANSQGLKDLGNKFAPKKQIDIIHNGVNPQKFTPQARDWSQPNLLFIGRVVYQKGLDLIFEALSGLMDLPWILTIVGDGPERDHLVALAQKLCIQDRVQWVGWKHNHELVSYYQAATVFINPSRHEGMPNAVLEAMSMGLPVIATRIAGNEELVVPTETGFLISSEDSQSLRTALHELLIDETLREKLGTAGRVRVREHYTWESSAFRYLRTLEDVYALTKFPPQQDAAE